MLTICWSSKLAPHPGRGRAVPEPSKDVGEGSVPHAWSFLRPDWHAAFSLARGGTRQKWHPQQAPAWPAWRMHRPPPALAQQGPGCR